MSYSLAPWFLESSTTFGFLGLLDDVAIVRLSGMNLTWPPVKVAPTNIAHCLELDWLALCPTIPELIFLVLQIDPLLENTNIDLSSSLVSLPVSDSRFDTVLTRLVMHGVRREALYIQALITNNISTKKDVATSSQYPENVLVSHLIRLLE
ncbi:hypothetical protein IG631_17982 [Alternaria alternata]|nr:hypothetical protein IG631_17982 [Alternaria alternata]